MVEIFNLVKTTFLVLFLPGYVLSYVFLASGDINFWERMALAFSLSLTIVPLVIFYTSLLNVPINQTSVVYEILWLLSLAIIFVIFRAIFKGKKHD